MNLLERLIDVQKRVGEAAARARRDPDEVQLIPVSKFHPLEEIQMLMTAGITDFGENRVQELLEKQSVLSGAEVNWHLIGHLQRNKVKYVVRMPNLKLIHSVDSFRLAEEIQKRCETEEREMDILIQVNVANDDAKFGVPARTTVELIRRIFVFDRVKVKGLMTIVPEVDDPEEVRPYFRKLKELSMEIQTTIPGVEMTELSMGMTNDFEIAIEEGATMVRVGSAIFGSRNY